MWFHSGGDLIDRTRRACRRAMRLEVRGRAAVAEAVLHRAVRRAASAGDPIARQLGCESLARLCLGRRRPAEAAVWHQQALAAWGDAGCPGAPDLALAAAVAESLGDGSCRDESPCERASGFGERPATAVTAYGAVERARFYAAARDWRTALAWLQVAEAGASPRELSTVRRFRQSVRVLAALDADRTAADQKRRL